MGPIQAINAKLDPLKKLEKNFDKEEAMKLGIENTTQLNNRIQDLEMQRESAKTKFDCENFFKKSGLLALLRRQIDVHSSTLKANPLYEQIPVGQKNQPFASKSKKISTDAAIMNAKIMVNVLRETMENNLKGKVTKEQLESFKEKLVEYIH